MLRIYNTLTRNKDEFVPLVKGRVGMYTCGPTVYDEPHIGHARSAYVFDVIRRYLTLRGDVVTFVRNVTDVDDKIIEKARSLAAGDASPACLADKAREVSRRYLDAYHRDMAALGIGVPDREPKATEYIPGMVAFIEELIGRSCAYEAGGDVYFDITKAKGYGKLSHQSAGMMDAGARVAPGEKKRNALDFALWKAAKEGEPSWESPWGRGRPGWHIECSVMSSDILGDEFDIHGGGLDLIFPHHENEIAQSEGAGKRFARCWIHHGLLTIRGEKMAKSLGNFVSIRDFLLRHKDPDYLKLFFLAAHYRSPVDYTEEKIEEAKSQKERFLILLDRLGRIAAQEPHAAASGSPDEVRAISEEARRRFTGAMDDDFNTPEALAALFDFVTAVNRFVHSRDRYTKDEQAALGRARETLLALSGVFSLALTKAAADEGAIGDGEVERRLQLRDEARRKKDFKKADGIRKELFEKGVILEDTKEGTEWRRRI